MPPVDHRTSMDVETILILDFGSQYAQLIARRVREAGVYSEIHPFNKVTKESLAAFAPRAVILSGGPASVTEMDTPRVPDAVFEMGVPVLGICYGEMIMAQQLGGRFIACQEKADALVEHFMVGGMGLDSGLEYFGLHDNKATIVRGDRPDIQMAALKTPTSCMVLTNGIGPIEYVLNEAEVEEIPLILTKSHTLDVMEAFGSAVNMARFDHPSKLVQFEELVSQNIDIETILTGLGLST